METHRNYGKFYYISMTNEERIQQLESRLREMEELLTMHKHTGSDTQKINYGRLENQPISNSKVIDGRLGGGGWTIEGGKLTGGGITLDAANGSIETATSGQRIVMSTTDFTLYNSNNGTVGTFNSTGGKLQSLIVLDGDDKQALFIDNQNLTSTKITAALKISANTTGLKVYDSNDILEDVPLVYFESSSTNASRTSEGYLALFSNTGKGAGVKITGNNALTGNSLLVAHFSTSGFPVEITQFAITETNFKKVINFAGATLFVSDGTNPDGNLTGAVGDICLNGPNGIAYYCDTAGTNWTAM